MFQCSFCDQPLKCKVCNKPFRPKSQQSHLGMYQPDVIVSCPECQNTLVCKHCGFVYGEEAEEDES